MKLNKDCRHFKGYKPCDPHKKHGVECEGCTYYDKITSRILLMNLDGIGDVVRTTSLILPLKEKYPGCHITWLTSKNSARALEGVSEIDRVLIYDFDTALRLQAEHFDLLINLEKAEGVAALSTKISADKKLGISLDNDGFISAYNPEAQYFIDIGVSDIRKKASRKTQQEIIFDITGIPYKRNELLFHLPQSSLDFAQKFFSTHDISDKDTVIGFNTGCSSRIFTDRKWTVEGYVELAKLLYDKYQAKILLLGGPEEIQRNAEIAKQCNVPVINTGNDNSLHDFAALMKRCNLLISGDTMAVHLAAALKVTQIVMFGMVSAHEIEIYDRGSKIISPHPCKCSYNYKCTEEKSCMQHITPQHVFDEAQKVL